MRFEILETLNKKIYLVCLAGATILYFLFDATKKPASVLWQEFIRRGVLR